MHHLACWSIHACCSGWIFWGEVSGGGEGVHISLIIYFMSVLMQFLTILKNKFMGGSNVNIITLLVQL